MDDIDWGECERGQLYVQDAFAMIGVSASYSQLYDSRACIRMDREDELVWGHSYQLVTTRCPHCTVCAAPCARSSEEHVLCTHEPSMTCVHLWHNVRDRPPDITHDDGADIDGSVVIQGYIDEDWQNFA